jgi:hypothetical protein
VGVMKEARGGGEPLNRKRSALGRAGPKGQANP